MGLSNACLLAVTVGLLANLWSVRADDEQCEASEDKSNGDWCYHYYGASNEFSYSACEDKCWRDYTGTPVCEWYGREVTTAHL